METNPDGRTRGANTSRKECIDRLESEPQGRDQGRQHARNFSACAEQSKRAKERQLTMLLTTPEIARDQPVGSWFCLRSQPKREHIAAACLRQMSDVEVFCPRVRLRKRTNRGLVWFVESMFPGYLFSRFNYATSHRQSDTDLVSTVLYTSGASRVIA
jgi:hypothetical protein